ncbi:MAG: hypothetical protein RL277_2044, partial [Planctomycetota bacterium]
MRILAILTLLCFGTLAHATDRHVYPGSSIQAAINASVNGDRVLVHAGTYPAGIRFNGKLIEVIAVDGPTITTLDATNAPFSAVTFDANETLASKLKGFTIKGGVASTGAGIRIFQASPTIQDCVIRDGAAQNGGGVHATGSSALIIGCTIRNNSAVTGGGGLYFSGGSPSMATCTVLSNTANQGAGIYCTSTTLAVQSGGINENTAITQGGGFYSTSSTVTITDALISTNLTTVANQISYPGGAGIWSQSSTVTMLRVWLANNLAN